MESNIFSFNTLVFHSVKGIEILGIGHTISTYKRSSSIRVSCMSIGMWSKLSCLAFPLLFPIAFPPKLTREFNGALTKDVSAMKDGSSQSLPISKLSLNNQRQQRKRDVDQYENVATKSHVRVRWVLHQYRLVEADVDVLKQSFPLSVRESSVYHRNPE